jgi:hypothetical protein
MDILLIQLINNKAAKLISDLEDLQIIKILNKDEVPKENFSEKFSGSLNLTDKEYNDIQQQLTDMRNEWE